MREARPTRYDAHASSRDHRVDGSSSDDDDGVDAFVLRETKSRGWDEFRNLLDDVRAYRRRDVDAGDADADADAARGAFARRRRGGDASAEDVCARGE